MKSFNVFLIVFILFQSCETPPVSDLTKNSLIPIPRITHASGDYFLLSEKTEIITQEGSEALEFCEAILRTYVSGEYEYMIKDSTKFHRAKNNIKLLLSSDSVQHPEGYHLNINKKEITLSAPNPNGLFRGIQTLRQLISLPGSEVRHTAFGIALPTGSIMDYPAYEYRGTMLDVSRHFFSPGVVKQYIDQLALYKINYLHLHLSDDQGWRIEIKSWPKLTEIGGSTQVGGGPGGFYTQEEYADIVSYAAERFITIVPEIDMPGHTNAALASYAELNCDGKATELYTGTRVGFSTLCTRKEITYTFVEDVIRELVELTPGPYFHVGGDESHVTELEDYIYFMNRVRKIVQKHGKKVIGWDEISHADLDSSDIAQYWASAENAGRALAKGAQLIISPAKYAYLDMKYDSTTALGLNWAGYTEVDKAYAWEPLELIEGISQDQILGIESPLWSETIETLDEIEFLAFPRLIGHAEIGWSDPQARSWESYRKRLADHAGMLDALGIDFYRSDLVDW